MLKDRGIILRKRDFTETSLIVHWLSRERGILHTVAKAARRPKSGFAGRIDLFFSAEFEFHPSRSSELHTLKELVVQNDRRSLAAQYPRFLAGAYFCSLVERCCERETPMPEVHDLLERALDYLATAESVGMSSVPHFERRLATELGLGVEEREPKTLLAELGSGLPKSREQALGALGR